MVKKKPSTAAGNGTITVVLKVGMHCNDCAHKVVRSLKDIKGVGEVKLDMDGRKVTVTAAKDVDPWKICDRVRAKTHKNVELVSAAGAEKPDAIRKANEGTMVEGKALPPGAALRKKDLKQVAVVGQPKMNAAAAIGRSERRKKKDDGDKDDGGWYYYYHHHQQQPGAYYYAHPPQHISDDNPNVFFFYFFIFLFFIFYLFQGY